MFCLTDSRRRARAICRPYKRNRIRFSFRKAGGRGGKKKEESSGKEERQGPRNPRRRSTSVSSGAACYHVSIHPSINHHTRAKSQPASRPARVLQTPRRRPAGRRPRSSSAGFRGLVAVPSAPPPGSHVSSIHRQRPKSKEIGDRSMSAVAIRPRRRRAHDRSRPVALKSLLGREGRLGCFPSAPVRTGPWKGPVQVQAHLKDGPYVGWY